MVEPGSGGRRHVLVTGAGRGLGRACAVELAARGTRLTLTDIDPDTLGETSDRITALGGDVVARACDLRDPDALRDLLSASTTEPIDGLVAAAGVMRTSPLSELSDDEWESVLAVNTTSTFRLVRDAAALMGTGSMVIISSVAGRSGRSDAAHYAASKAALLSLTKSAALALAPRIRVNAVCPGVFLTPMWTDIIGQRDDRFGPGAGQRHLEKTLERVPLGRVGDPLELARVVAFLLSDDASYVTGQSWNVDGGLEMS